MSHVFHRSAHSQPPVATRAQGSYIIDQTGKRYLDACGGAAVSCIGHGHPMVVAAIAEQAATMAYAHTGFFTSTAAEQLADMLIAGAPGRLKRVYFVSSGSEAVETALKMAHQYHQETGASTRRHVISRWQSYHGNTIGALSAGGNRWRRRTYQGILCEMHHISPCYAYRGQQGDETLHAYGQRMADELDAKIQKLGADTVSAFIAETVVGATLGAVEPAPGYFARIREICDRHGVLLILDEVMCGLGRTGWQHACQAEGVAPDIMVIAKGLGAGYVPLGAVLASGEVHDAFARGSGSFQHGHTFVGHPVACASALAVQQVVRDDGLVARSATQGAKLRAMLQASFDGHPSVGDLRGRGLFQALELVDDRGTKTPFDPSRQIAARLKVQAQNLGLLCYPMSGTMDGLQGDHVLLAPPFTVSDVELADMVAMLSAALEIVVDTGNGRP